MRVWLLPLLAVTIAGCLWSAAVPEPEVPDGAMAPLSSTVVSTRFCGDCHYGMDQLWSANWVEKNLTLRPAYTDAPLFAIQRVDEGAFTIWESGIIQETIEETYTYSFDVSAEATGIFARAHGTATANEEAQVRTLLQGQANHFTTAMQLISPSGKVFEANSPDADLKLLALTDTPERGTWQLQASLDRAGDIVILVETLRGDVVASLPTPPDNVTWNYANATDARYRLRPYHDHAAFENSDWDLYDTSPFEVSTVWGPAIAPVVWNETAIDSLWPTPSYVFSNRGGTSTGAFLDEEGHNDVGVGSSYPGFGPLGNPVLPGTTIVDLRLTWTPATSEPNFNIKFSPANTPYFYDAIVTAREAGSASFQIAVEPLWWEDPTQVLAWLDPDAVTSYWDIAPYFVENGQVQARAIDWELTATAIRD